MSFRRIATVGLASVSAVAAITAFAVSASGSSAPAAPAATANMGATMVFKSVTTQESDVDNGKKGFSVGDQFTFADDLFAWGTDKKVGTDGGLCAVVWRKGDDAAVQCVATMRLKGGQVTVQGLSEFDSNEEGQPFVVAVTGGTGKYTGATGTLTVKDISEKASKLTLKLDRGHWAGPGWEGDDDWSMGGAGGNAD